MPGSDSGFVFEQLDDLAHAADVTRGRCRRIRVRGRQYPHQIDHRVFADDFDLRRIETVQREQLRFDLGREQAVIAAGCQARRGGDFNLIENSISYNAYLS